MKERVHRRATRSSGRRDLGFYLFFCLLLSSTCLSSVGVHARGDLDSREDFAEPTVKEEELRYSQKIETNDEDRWATPSRQFSSKSAKDDERTSWTTVLAHASKRGLGGGISGALAGVVQVITLMWLRTLINYQCRYGTTFAHALRTLLHEGGLTRLYRGLGFALIQAPLVRFVSTAANEGVVAFLASFTVTRHWGPGRTTMIAAIVVGAWRIFLMPIDTIKTVLQVDSSEGFRSLMRRVKGGKFMALYEGALANALSAIVGHYPWFYTFNFLSKNKWVQTMITSTILRNAGIGLTASVVSDVVVNAIRVVKTTKQSMGSRQAVTYSEVIRVILAADGWRGLFGRGLRTRIFANALQSILFTIVWRALAEHFGQNRRDSQNDGSSGGSLEGNGERDESRLRGKASVTESSYRGQP